MKDIKFQYEVSFKSIQEHREEQGITQSELSRRTNLRIPQGKISNLEAGFINLTSDSALCLANALKTNIIGLLLGQDMANKGIALKDREKLVKAISEGKSDLLKAYKSAHRVKKALDFGDRDSFGAKLPEAEILARKRIRETGEGLDFGGKYERDSFGNVITKRESEYRARKRAEKRAKKSKDKALDFGDRDSFGRKKEKKKYDDTELVGLKNIIAMKMAVDFDNDFLETLKGLNEDDRFLAILNRLIEKAKERKMK